MKPFHPATPIICGETGSAPGCLDSVAGALRPAGADLGLQGWAAKGMTHHRQLRFAVDEKLGGRVAVLAGEHDAHPKTRCASCVHAARAESQKHILTCVNTRARYWD